MTMLREVWDGEHHLCCCSVGAPLTQWLPAGGRYEEGLAKIQGQRPLYISRQLPHRLLHGEMLALPQPWSAGMCTACQADLLVLSSS